MKAYMILWDNNESWEDHAHGIEDNHVYFDPRRAEDECFKLNNPEPFTPTVKDWMECGWDCTWEQFIEDYEYQQSQRRYSYSVKEIDIK